MALSFTELCAALTVMEEHLDRELLDCRARVAHHSAQIALGIVRETSMTVLAARAAFDKMAHMLLSSAVAMGLNNDNNEDNILHH
jgi:hypothetical protein